MKTLSVKQPWAHAIIHLGKDVENRNWKTNYRGPLLIHAGMTVPDELVIAIVNHLSKRGSISGLDTLEYGGIIGIVDLIDCVQKSNSRWAEYGARDGVCHWVLSNPRPLPFLPLRGRLGLFEAEHPKVS